MCRKYGRLFNTLTHQQPQYVHATRTSINHTDKRWREWEREKRREKQRERKSESTKTHSRTFSFRFRSWNGFPYTLVHIFICIHKLQRNTRAKKKETTKLNWLWAQLNGSTMLRMLNRFANAEQKRTKDWESENMLSYRIFRVMAHQMIQ